MKRSKSAVDRTKSIQGCHGCRCFRLALHEIEKFPAVQMLNQPQLNLPVDSVGKHGEGFSGQGVKKRISPHRKGPDVAEVDADPVESESPGP